MVISLSQNLSADLDYSIVLTVQRSGLVLAALVSFVKNAEFLFDRVDATQLGRDSVKSLALNEKDQDVVLSFVDTGADEHYQSTYVVVMKGESDGKVVFSKQFDSQEILKANKSAAIAMPATALDDSQNYLVTLGVARQGHVLSAPVKFETQGKYARLLNAAPFSDEALAIAFERYLKSGSGRAFAKKRL